MANGHGGARPGSGRKKKQTREIRDKALADAGADAEYALGLLVGYMRDEQQSDSFRTGCALNVMDRVWGKPTQHQTVDAAVVWSVEYGDEGSDITAPPSDTPPAPAPEAATDQAEHGEA